MQTSHQSKYKPGVNKNMQLDFAQLNENNKSEFLQFLLKNNITFEKCNGKNDNGNYIAKVTITKDVQQKGKAKNKNKHQKSMFDQQNHKTKNMKINTTSLSASKNVNKSTTMKTPRKQNTAEIKNTKNNLNKEKQNIPKQKGKLMKNQYNNKSVKSVSIKNKQNQNHFGPKSVRTTEFHAEQSILCASKKNNLNQNVKVALKDQNKKSDKQQKQKANLINKQNSMRLRSRQNTNKSLSFSKQKSQVIQKQKINDINDKIRRKTELQKQITQLVNRFLKLFDLKLQGHRPMRWSLAQLVKTIQQIYDWVFQKNTQSLTQKGCNKQYQSAYSNHFIKFVKQFFISKHKNDKLASSNLINMLYSLSLYLQNEKKLLYQSFPSFKTQARQIKATLLMTATGVFMQTFEDFLCHIYQFQDLLFFLFIRSICCNQLRGSNPVKGKLQKQNNKVMINQVDLVFGLKQVSKILKSILGDDEQLLQQYLNIIKNHLKTQNQQKLTKQIDQSIKISCSQFMALMIQDYKRKRLIMQQQMTDFGNSKNMSIANYSVTQQNTFQSLIKKGFPKYKEKQQIKESKSANLRNQNDTNQLTFGQETQQNIQQLLSMHSNFDFDKQFWQTNFQTKQLKNYEQDSVQQLICQKMKRKVKQFISILIQNRSQYNSLQTKGERKKYQSNKKNILCYELLLRKSLSLLSSIIDMNKLQWFDELKVTDPNQNDIDKVQQLQLIYRKIKDNPEAQQIGKICKSILTTPQVTTALEKLMNAENQFYTHF